MKQLSLKTIFVALIGSCSLSGQNSDTVVVKTTEEGTKGLILQTSKRDRFYFGPEIFWTNTAPAIKEIHVKDHSIYYGLTAGYEFLRPNALYLGIEGLYALGRMHIKAQHQKTKIYQDHVPGTFANAELRLGYNFHLPESFYLTPFIGFGGYHVRPIRSIHYVQNWLYVAMGMKTEYEVNPDFSVGVNLTGTHAVYLEQRIKKHKYSSFYHNNTNVFGYEISFPLTLKIGDTKNWALRLEPYYLKLNSHSDANAVGGKLTFNVCY